MVVLLYDASGEGEAKTPSAFLGSVAWIEYSLEPVARQAFSGVGHFNPCVAVGASGSDSDRAFGFHGVDGVFDEVFHYPLEE